MILVVTERSTGAIDTFNIKSITDISKDSRTIVEVEHIDGDKDKLDLHTYKLDFLPRPS